MYVRVLFEPAGRGKRFAALGARVRPGTRVIGPDVPLQVTRIAEHLRARLASELPAMGQGQMSDKARFPTVRLRAQLAAVLAGPVLVSGH